MNRLFDKYGNELWCDNQRVYLRLKDSNRIRCLGAVDGDSFYTQRKDLHTMRNLHDVGFNYALMKRGKFKNVVVEFSDGTVLRTTREKILEEGECRHFKSEGYELQIFLPLSQFQQEEVAVI